MKYKYTLTVEFEDDYINDSQLSLMEYDLEQDGPIDSMTIKDIWIDRKERE